MTKNKEKLLCDNLEKVIQQFMKGKRYDPMGQVALFKRLKLPEQLHPLCKKILKNLVDQGIVIIQKKRYLLKTQETPKKLKSNLVLLGTLRVHNKGFGFVIPDNPSDATADVFIPKHLIGNAVDGDHVEVEVNPHSNLEKGPEGKIAKVLKRGRKQLAGIVRYVDHHGTAFIHTPLLGASKEVVIEKGDKLKIGDRILMHVQEWGEDGSPILCDFSRKIGNISDPSVDILAAIEEFDLPRSFPEEAVKEAKSYGKTTSVKDLKNRTNFTELECFTIDPETAKDFDDALSLRKTRNGNFQLAVHIADVAHYVKIGSALDAEAAKRANSTYFPGTCIPMLPEELSNQLCSLKAKVKRLTVTVLMEFDPQGSLVKHKIVRSYIRSQKRFTYEEAKLVLDGRKKSIHASTLRLMVELCLLLKKKRYERGSVDFSLPELVIHVDPNGMPEGVKWVEYDITHQLVEEFMLKANEIVAKELTERQKNPLFRIHEEPATENFEDFLNTARSLGFIIPKNKPTIQDIQLLFEQAKTTPYLKQLSIGFIRCMKLAYYSPENVGHFGLALEYYTHFTSPIRRYCDLVIHRLLFDEEDKEQSIEKIALKCSDQERVSFRAENNVKLLKKLRLLGAYFKEDPGSEYEAVITKIKPFGIYFEITALMLEGFLHISELGDDYFVFDKKQNSLIGKDTKETLSCGNRILVRLMSLDLIMLETKWERIQKKHKKTKSSLHRKKKSGTKKS